MNDQTSASSSSSSSGGAVPDRIDAGSEASVSQWARKLDATDMQIRDAIAEVGSLATDVEMHLKGSRSTTNDDRVDEAGGTTGAG
ncbi:DUF3606 domain-containing protein [Xylophilus sp. GOD-11R]|uniref:DUF3606 domain-containing protein n=1 Tax=Xylophilus sp. GOD-11R TaxID=3089814 RepID=UPI00298C58FC|nr:DUF3606 domain-containing protein [Xylophilus sp. GOD-11R]WPB58352.1 DUF3606 domain-containing protein [Xylophilus sp. GOD-11R]